MDDFSSEEEEIETKKFHGSVNCFKSKNPLTLEEDKRNYNKRSSSMPLNLSRNFVPTLKPTKTIICPSPINLSQKPPPQIPGKANKDKENKNLSSSLEDKKYFSIKPIKLIYSQKRNLKKSSNFLNIEEETHETEAISDCEDKSKKVDLINFDSDSSSSSEMDDKDGSKYNKSDILKNINVIREKMMIIRKNSIKNENINDDSNIGFSYESKRLRFDKNAYQEKFIDKMRKKKNMNVNPLNSNKYRTKTFNIKQRYVSTILGFLENNSSYSLNSNGK